MSIEKIRIRLEGQRPLLMHASRFVDPLDPVTIDLARLTSKRMKTRADHEEIARVEWYGGMWARNGRPCILGQAIEAAIVAAARSVRKGKSAQVGFFCPESPLLLYPGPSDLDELWADPRYRLRHPVQVHQARTIRTRPRFPEWKVEFEAEFVPTALSRDELMDLFRVAGFREGLGDWRPKYGRFEATAI